MIKIKTKILSALARLLSVVLFIFPMKTTTYLRWAGAFLFCLTMILPCWSKEYPIHIFFAADPVSRKKGLAGVESRQWKNSDVMMFVFDYEGVLFFNMEDMKFNLDMIFLDHALKVVKIERNCKKNEKVLRSSAPHASQYVLEMKPSDLSRIIHVGDKLDFIYLEVLKDAK